MKTIDFGEGNGPEKVFEETVPKGDLNRFSLIFNLIFNKKFYFYLGDTIKYALRHYDCYRGTGVSEVMIFAVIYSPKNLWKKV